MSLLRCLRFFRSQPGFESNNLGFSKALKTKLLYSDRLFTRVTAVHVLADRGFSRPRDLVIHNNFRFVAIIARKSSLGGKVGVSL